MCSRHGFQICALVVFRRALVGAMIFKVRDKDPRRVVIVRREANARSRSRRVDAPGAGGTIQVGPDDSSWCDDRESDPGRAMGARCMFRLVVVLWY